MRIGSDRSLSSGRTLAFSTPNTSATNSSDHQLPLMIDAGDELDGDPQRRGVDQQRVEGSDICVSEIL